MRRRKISAFVRSFVQKRALNCCEYCQFPFEYSHAAFHIEHIVPLQAGGSDDLDNLAFACDGCNSNKWIHFEWPDPKDGQKSILFNPRKDIWQENLLWSDDFTTITGMTPKGRSTIDLLKMNR